MAGSDQAPNTKHVTVNHPVPRDPGAYRPTIHFGQRLRERVPDDQRDRVVRTVIERGRVYGTTPPDDVPDHAVKQFFAFERTVEGVDWRVVVGIRPAAFLEAGKTHLAVTIMEVLDG